jgi:hypothetical protein
MTKVIACLAALLLTVSAQPALAQSENMTFFIVGAGPGDGANLGGLAGADQYCQTVAEGVGAGHHTWHAYLSATAGADGSAVHARDRIGAGPWHNYEGVLIAESVDQLHGEDANLTKESILTEAGQMVNGRGDDPNRHDIITGSTLDGRLFVADDGGDTTCGDWASNSSDGSARVGHHDRQGGGQNPTSWNSAHGSRGCGQEDLQGTGGDGLFYCFAIDPR